MSIWDSILAYSPEVLWKLNEAAGVVADDASPNNRDGTYVNTPTLGEPSLLVSMAETSTRLTKAQSETILRAHESWMNGVTFTIGCWVKIPSGTMQNGELYGHLDCVQLWTRSNGELHYYSFNGGWQLMTAPAGTIAAGGTYFIVVTNGAAGRNIVVNGVVKATSGTRQDPRSLSNTLNVGRSSIGTEYLDGWVQGFFWIPSQLTVTQIQALHTEASTVSTAPTQPGSFSSPLFGEYKSGTFTVDWGDSTNVDSYTLEKWDGTSWTAVANTIIGSAYNWNASGVTAGAYKLRVKAVRAGEADSVWRESETFLLNSGSGPAIWPAIVAHSPELLWKLNELSGAVALDSSGNSRAGDLVNAPTMGQPSLIPNAPLDNSMLFSTAGHKLAQRGHEPWMNSDTFTLGVWMKFNGARASLELFGKVHRFQCWVRGDGGVYFYEFDTDWRLVEAPAGSIPDDGAAHFVVISNSATARKIYVDGVKVSPVSSGSAPQDSTNPVQVGHSGETANANEFNGWLQGFFWIPTQLSDADVLALHDQAQTEPVPPTIPGAFTSPPEGGSYVAETIPVAWGASSDGDPTYDLEYTRDDGATWHTVTSGVAGTEYDWDTNTRGGTYRLRVRATNVFGSSDWVESDSFTLQQLQAGFNKIEDGILFEDPHNAPGLDPDSASWETDVPPNAGRWDAEGPLQTRWREGFGYDIVTDDDEPIEVRKPTVKLTINDVRFQFNVKTPCPRVADCEWTVVMGANQYLVIEVWREYDDTDPLLPAGEGDPVMEGYLLGMLGDAPNITQAATGTASFAFYHTKTKPGGVNMNLWLKGIVYNDVVPPAPGEAVTFSEDDTIAREVESDVFLLAQFAPCGGWT